ncbi:VanZ family protein [Rhodopirellula sp. JC740]|uniref:VanZ family protein n=1 Tax=Rhodopirellula halodulae TaxID=2894198 RepID=A0ABS8NR34_9BACT|nr:VanZ family protein [Rhodopirellula sp. JC740]MCC9645283.1 VanZ family protein [Rhodopirellula sp. JC740]
MQPVTKLRLLGIRLGVLCLASYWIAIFVGTHLPKLPSAMPKLNDKVMHFAAFFGLAMLLCYCTNSPRIWRRFPIIVAMCLVYACVDELTQSFVRGRHSDPMDFLADMAGTVTAVVLYATARWFWLGQRDADDSVASTSAT